jgi:hypothetical protein
LIRKENEIFTNGLVEEDTGLTIKIAELFAIDSNGQLIHNPATTQLTVPSDSNWYWVKVAYNTTTEEKGTFSIDSFGNLTCTSADGELLTILRGQPNYPSRIYFTNAVNNILEYDIEDVVSDNNAVLTGSFTSESGLKLAVVGTFTPGYVPLTSEKFIFQYDYCTVTLVSSNTTDAPVHTTGEEFFIARVKNDGVTLKVEDKRNEIWKTNANYFLSNLDKLGNPLIGVEQITYDDSLSTKVQNIVQLAWAFTASAFSVNLKLNKITINAGSGGLFKPTTFFSDFTIGDFDGWRLYVDSGKYYKITSSAQVASTIELIMESLDAVDFFSDIDSVVSITQNLIITPDVEEIEVICTPDPVSTNTIVQKNITFPINSSYGKIPLNVYDSINTLYNIKYRYKHIKDYSAALLIPDDTTGFYNESQFDSNGVLIVSPTRTPYTANISNGFIPLQLNVNAYSNFVDRIDLGDLLGVDVSTLSNGAPLVDLVVGQDRQYQYFGDKDNSVGNDQITLSADMFVNLNKLNVSGDACKNGNFFMLHFKQSVLLSGFNLRIVTDYINPTPGNYTELRVFDSNDEEYLQNSLEGIYIRATFDGTDWILTSEPKIFIADDSNITSSGTFVDTGAKLGEVILSTTEDFDNVFVIYNGTFQSAGAGTNTMKLRIYKNATIMQEVTHTISTATYFANMTIIDMFDCVAGDVITVYGYAQTGFSSTLTGGGKLIVRASKTK